MRQLMFDEFGPDLENLVKDRSRHGPEAMAGHLVLTIPHAPQGSKNGVVAHRAQRGAVAWEDIPDNGQRKSPCFQGAYALYRTLGNLAIEMTACSLRSNPTHAAKPMQ